MTPEHTDRDLRERIEAEVEWLRNTAAGLKVEPESSQHPNQEGER